MLRRLRNALREQGVAALGLRGTNHFLDVVSAGRLRVIWYVLVAQPVHVEWRIPAKLGQSITIRALREHDVLLQQAPRPRAILEQRFAQGAICIAAERSGNLIGFLWLCPVKYLEDDVRCIFILPDTNDTWWDFDVWILETERNGILFARLWQFAHELLRKKKAEWTCSRITRNNSGSIAAHKRLGAIVVGHALFVCGKQWQVTFSRNPKIHISSGTTDVPAISVGPPVSQTKTKRHSCHTRHQP